MAAIRLLCLLVVLGVNSAVAGARTGTRGPSLAADLVFVILIVITLLINSLTVLRCTSADTPG